MPLQNGYGMLIVGFGGVPDTCSFHPGGITVKSSPRARALSAPVFRTCTSCFAAGLLALAALPASAQVSLTTLDVASTQNFDSLPTTGSVTWVDNSTISGWYLARSGTPAPPFAVAASSGTSTSGSFFSYGTGTAAERALGSQGSNGTLDQFYGVRLQNNTGSTITSIEVAYVGEQWRNGGNAAVQSLAFSYVVGASPLTDLTSTGTSVASLNFASPVTGTTAAALDGNAAANRAAISATISGLSIPVGGEIMLRWKDINDAGNDHGLAIDDVSVTPHGAGAATPALSINDVSQNEGDSGTTVFTFTVSLSAASASAVTFDVATQDGSATAPSDYTAIPTTPLTIPAGQTSTTFTVLVNGDTTVEPNETFFVNLSNANGANIADSQGQGTIVNDDVPPPTITPIHDVQGSVVGTTPGSINGCGSGNDSSPKCGQTVTVEAVVTATFPALSAGQLGGFNLQEETADADTDDTTSEGIFIYCPSCTGIEEGDRVRVTGTVAEFFGMTQISALPAGVVVTEGTSNHLSEVTPAHITLPIPVGTDINAYYEAREGMLVQFDDDLTVSEYFELFRYGQVILVAGDRPRTFTEDNAPSVSGLAAHLDSVARRQVILDDDRDGDETPLNQANGQQAVYWPHTNGGFSLGTQGQDFFRGGDKVHNLVGVLQWSRPGSIQTPASTWRVRPSNSYPVTFTPVNLRPQTPPDVGGSIRVVGMNLLNYFTTIDTTSSTSSGPCGPGHTLDCRGADSQAELDRQTARAAKVICDLNPDVASFMELENNDVPSPTATISYLLNAVNQRCGGAHPYAFQNNAAGTLGTDAIRVMIVYRSGIVSPVGAAMVDMDSIHSRPPMAQTFDVTDSTNYAFGKRFTVVANHFKSKGSCPTDGSIDTDQNDGQACWAEKRRLQALRTTAWVSGTVIPAAGSNNVLLLGDFNSYASETSVQALEAAGYHDLETELHGTNAYSYLFGGEIGHLDYAFANSAMRNFVSGADAWHINADEVDLFDYNDDIKDTGEPAYDEKPDGSALMPARTLWDADLAIRASDHDPVLVGLFPVVPQGQLTITPTALAFGDQALGTTSAPQSVTLANTGNAALSVTVDGANDPFTLAGASTCGTTSPITIAMGASCTLVYTFMPSVTGAAAQTLAVTANGPGSGSIALSGNGTQGHLSIAPSTVDFGDQAIFSAGAPQTVTLVNDGTATLHVTALDAAAAPFVRGVGTCATTLPITLAANASCTLTYTFMPTTTGQATQLLAVTVDALGSGSFLLLGNGVQGHLAISPANVDFGNQTTGTTSAAQSITITNDGGAPLIVNSLTAATSPFARVAGGCAATPFTLAVNANCTLTYTFTPTSAGAASQNLTVSANAPGNGTIALSGNGTLPPTADVAVTLAHNADYVQYGDTVSYVITVTNATGSASATVQVLDMLPGGLINGAWTCTHTGAATCANGNGDTLGDTIALPVGTQVQYVYSATVQAGAPELLANQVTAAVTNVGDPNTGNNTASDTVEVVIFRDGFDNGATTLALAPYSDSQGFASLALTIDRDKADAAGIMPIAIASGRADDGRIAFTLELARFGANTFLRLTTIDAKGVAARGEWQAARFDQPLDFAWQSATRARNDGYMRIAAGQVALQSTGDDNRRLIELRIPAGQDATPWLSVQLQ